MAALLMRVITGNRDLAEICQRLAGAPFVAVDTEFMREQTFWPQLCLVQLAGPEDEAIVDPLARGLDLAPFYRLMADERVVKVFHAARQDIEIIHAATRRVPHPLFDTQIAAMVCGFGDSISYGSLVKRLTGEDIDKSSRFTDWSRRPLSAKQLAYALGDVTHLRPVYQALQSELDRSGRASWVDEEMAALTNPKTYELHPEDAWRRLKARVRGKKAFAVLIEVAAWREQAAQAQNVPRQRMLRDEALYDIANQTPAGADDLAKLRTLSQGFSRSGRAREILAAVQRGVERDPKTLPALSRGEPLPAAAEATVELLKVLLRAQAAEHRVAARLIADTDDLERLAVEANPDVPALRGWRRGVFGEKALRLRQGEIALTLAGDSVAAVPVARRAAE